MKKREMIFDCFSRDFVARMMVYLQSKIVKSKYSPQKHYRLQYQDRLVVILD